MKKQKKPYVKPKICLPKNTSDVAYEVCILCGAITNIPKSLPVDWRSGYIPGAGQLCHECAVQIVNEDKSALRNGYV